MNETDQMDTPDGDVVVAQQRGPLVGVRVLELGVLLAGPFIGRLLGDFGAEIIKTELPGVGDPLRDWGVHRYKDRSLWWAVQSRNKKLITLNLRDPRGQEMCRQLAAKSDVVVENFRPGTLERWGLGPEELHAVNPKLIIARVSGYGQTGPYSSRAGFASAGEAMGGLRYINGYPGAPPPRAGVSLGDSLAAMFAAQGVLMALYHRDAHGGPGQVIDASILESCFALLEGAVPEFDRLGIIKQPGGTAIPHVAPSNLYQSSDGKWMVIAANAENLWQRLCRVMDRADLIDDPKYALYPDRLVNAGELDEIIAAWARERTAEEINGVLNAAGVVCSPVYSIQDIFQDPHFREREMLLDTEHAELGPIVAPGIVPKLSDTPGGSAWNGSYELGAWNAEVYRELLGLDAKDLEELARDGII